jgi:2-polyprenyl-3-methyl-5-hydroxy-6-metoxy-1,4-benzoquinol methylase
MTTSAHPAVAPLPATRLAVEYLPHCPICQAPEAELLFTQPDGYLQTLHLHRCQRCQTIYLNPRLTLDSIVAVEEESEVYTFDQTVAERWIKEGLTPLMILLESYLQQPGRRLLDIGCNRGLLMEAARRRGWSVTGVEIASEAANRARADYKLTVYSSLDELDPSAQFDLITAWHVLEHTLDPVGLLRRAAALLAPGGILALQVPSFDYLTEYDQRNQIGGLICTVHNFYFTQANLPAVLERTGLPTVELFNDPNSLALTAICTKPASQPWFMRWFQWGPGN